MDEVVDEEEADSDTSTDSARVSSVVVMSLSVLYTGLLANAVNSELSSLRSSGCSLSSSTPSSEKREMTLSVLRLG